ncbi:ribosome biogenesis regulatory protein homolog [Anneissia japonica]|uniref:ribosome biogenesis regulatory protein homolog n=1 Tax=Anneissia japonica TaxID=1529436 RepID=UPI0014256F05|nr:ribosome biogenesis regulatory protein homolog [Anneissia japonica]
MMAADTVNTIENVLKNIDEEAKKFKSLVVKKDIEPTLDLGNLLVCDSNPIVGFEQRKNKNDFLTELARENTQLLFNEIWKLPAQRTEDVITVKLPEPVTRLPREKSIPKPKATTRWEKFAQMKGIQNKKKSRKVWDEELQKWVPRWGFQSKGDLKRDWLLEVPQKADPYEDQFAKKKKEKKERVAKNELQRLRNIARNSKKKVPGVGATPTVDKPNKSQLTQALQMAQKSTASLGKFDKKLPKEPTQRNTGKKRKFQPVIGALNAEKDRERQILETLNKKGKINVNQAVNREIMDDQLTGPGEKKEKKSKKKGKGQNRALPKSNRGPNKKSKSKGRHR